MWPAEPTPYHLVTLWLAGGLAIGLLTYASFVLDLDVTTTALAYLTIIVLLSLMDSFISAAIFSLIAIGCLDYFFIEPRFSFEGSFRRHLAMLFAFLVASFLVTGVVRQLRSTKLTHRDQARVLDLTHDTIYIRDKNDVITYWNRGAETLYGWSKEEAVGKTSFELLQPVLPVPYEEIIRTLDREGRWEGVVVQTKRDGSKISVSSRCILSRDESGGKLGTFITNTDITARLHAEDALRRVQATYLAEAQRLSSTGSFGWGIKSGEIFWSQQMFRIFEYEPDTPPTIPMVLARVHPEDRRIVEEVIKRAAEERQAYNFEHRLLMPGGRVKHVHVVAQPRELEPGHVQFMGAVTDITDRTQAYAALEKSEQRYRYLFRDIPIALWRNDSLPTMALLDEPRRLGVTDLGRYMDENPDFLRRAMDVTRVVEANRHAVRLFGARDEAEMLGPVERFWRASPQIGRKLLEARYAGQYSFETETRFATLDGRVIEGVFFYISFPLEFRLAGETLCGFVDSTDRIRAQETLQRVQAEFAHAARISMLGELAASIAHEINQPLTAITTFGQASLRWLDRAEPNVAEVRQLTGRMVGDARRAADIIVRIRKMIAGQAPEKMPLSLADVIRESLVFLEHEIRTRKVSVFLDFAPDLPQLRGDRTQLQQVIVNLMVNAMQIMMTVDSERRGMVIRTAFQAPELLICSVEDSGPGVKSEHLDHLFESFFTTKESGMGMGLSVSRSIIEAHGGSISADNKSALGGARFCFTLPTAGLEG